jgi:hypothetical protein
LIILQLCWKNRGSSRRFKRLMLIRPFLTQSSLGILFRQDRLPRLTKALY